MRYQVLVDGSTRVEEYPSREVARARVRTLKGEGVKAKVWDTRRNPLSDLLHLGGVEVTQPGLDEEEAARL